MSELHDESHLDPTGEISLDVVKQRAIKGVTALTGRHFLLYGISFVAQALLGAFLTPEQWGVFGLVSASVNFLVYFSDIGLAASLIQNKDTITEKDLKTTFTVQQLLVVTLLVILFLVSPFLQQTYGFSDEGKYLLYALGFSFFLSSLKTIPSVLLEREIKFEKIAAASIIENLLYNGVLIYLAWQGAGIMSFTWAVTARGIAGLIVIYLLRPWRPMYGFSKASLKKLLKFGLPYQVNTFISVLKDDGLYLLLTRLIGLEAMGLFVWAKKWADMPLRLFMDHVTKVTFPAFARMQEDKRHLANSVTRSVFFITFLVFPSVVGLILLAPLLVQVIPRYEKWTPALILLTILGVNAMIASFTTQLTNVLDAIGKIILKSKFLVMWTVLTLLLVPILAAQNGVIGAALGYLIVGLSSFIPVFVIKRLVNYSFLKAVVKNAIAVGIMGTAMIVLREILPVSAVSVGILMGVGGVTYVLAAYLINGNELIQDAKRFITTFRSK